MREIINFLNLKKTTKKAKTKYRSSKNFNFGNLKIDCAIENNVEKITQISIYTHLQDKNLCPELVSPHPP